MNEELFLGRLLTVVSLGVTLVALVILYNHDRANRYQPVSASAQSECIAESIRFATKPLSCLTMQNILHSCDPTVSVDGMCANGR